MKEYNIKELLESDTVVNCKTKKQTKNFFKYLHKLGYTWESGNELLELLSNFYKYLDETCFKLTSYKTVRYSPALYYKGEGYKVLSLKDIKIKKENK